MSAVCYVCIILKGNECLPVMYKGDGQPPRKLLSAKYPDRMKNRNDATVMPRKRRIAMISL